MQQNTLTTIENLQPGDLFCKEFGGNVYLVLSTEIVKKQHKVFTGKIRRINGPREILVRNNKLPVIFLKKHHEKK